MTRPIVHFEILGKDAKKLQDFYSALFGWSIDANNPMNYGLIGPTVGAPENGIGGGIAASQDGKPFVTVYVQVVDLNETLKKAESLGGKPVMQPMDVPGGPSIAQFSDPEGNVVGLVKQ
ncbi:MAG: VOC family protein [Dehalococcoidia bacterium]